MDNKYYVKNISRMMLCLNLATKNEKGQRESLILSKNEVSRPLTKAQFESPEIQKALEHRALLDVSAKMRK